MIIIIIIIIIIAGDYYYLFLYLGIVLVLCSCARWYSSYAVVVLVVAPLQDGLIVWVHGGCSPLGRIRNAPAGAERRPRMVAEPCAL